MHKTGGKIQLTGWSCFGIKWHCKITALRTENSSGPWTKPKGTPLFDITVIPIRGSLAQSWYDLIYNNNLCIQHKQKYAFLGEAKNIFIFHRNKTPHGQRTITVCSDLKSHWCERTGTEKKKSHITNVSRVLALSVKTGCTLPFWSDFH